MAKKVLLLEIGTKFEKQDQETLTFIHYISEKGLLANKHNFPGDYKEKKRGPCYVMNYNIVTGTIRSYPLYEIGTITMPAKYIFAATKKVQTLVENNSLFETQSIENRVLGLFRGGAKLNSSVYAWSGFISVVNEACSIASVIRHNQIRDMDFVRQLIKDKWNNNEFAEDFTLQAFKDIGW